MALKSVVDIVVNDAEFQRFQALFNNYKAGLAATPAAWTAANTAAAATTGAIAAGAQGLQHHVVLINQAATASKAAAAHTVSQAGAWNNMARNARSFAGHIFEATRSLLRWGELTGLISGILGGGGLFGIDRLAINAGERRKSALGLGVSPGEESAFKLNYGRILDSPDQMLRGVNEALHDVTKRVGLYGAGLTERDLAGKDSAQVSAELVPLLKKMADQTPDAMMAQVMQSRHLDQFMTLQDFQRLKNTPADQVAGYRTSYEKDRQTLDLTKEQARAWQDLQVQLKRAGESIENVFITALTPLAPAIGRLSDAFTKVVSDLLHNPHIAEWIDGLANSIKEFGDWIAKPQFKTDVNDFITYVGDLVKKVGDFKNGVEQVGNFLGVLWHTIDETGRKIADVAHLILDPVISLFGKIKTDDPDTLTGGALGRDSGGPGGAPSNPTPSPLIEEFKQWLHDRPKGGGYSDPSGEFGPPTASPSSFRQLEGQQGLPAGLLGVVYKTESNNNPNAISPAGAKGGFQFMDATARNYGVSNPFDLGQSAVGASRYFKDLLTEFHGDIAKAAAGYNWGQGNVEKDIRQFGDRWREHLPDETKNYVSKIERGLGGAAANGMKRASVDINISNATGANVTTSISQLAI